MRPFEKRAWPSLGNTPKPAAQLPTICAAAGDRVRGKGYDIGFWGGLIGQHHSDRMGSAVRICARLILRQKHQQGESGLVLRGSPLTCRERRMRTLRHERRIPPQTAAVGIVEQVTKAKKSTRFPQDVRKSAERLREVADRGTRLQPPAAAKGY